MTPPRAGGTQQLMHNAVVDASTFRDEGEALADFGDSGPGPVERLLFGSHPTAVRRAARAQASAWSER